MALTPEQTWALIAAIFWMLPWKGWALWRAARNGQRIWFAALLILQTLAALEILYLIFWSKPKRRKRR